MTKPAAVFAFENVSIGNPEGAILDGFNLTVKPREKVLITGRSGIGKTTIFRLILGFRKPQDGQVLFRGEKVDSQIAWRVRRQVAYVSQDVALGHGTVRDFFDRVFSYRANAEIAPDERGIREMLDRLQMPPAILGKDLADISGGEKQRIGISAAILLQRQIFLLDEITAALDPDLKRDVMKIFLEKPEWTVLAIAHDTSQAAGNARTVRLQ